MIDNETYEAAKFEIEQLYEIKNYLRDESIRLAKERDGWKAAYEEAMRPPRWIA